MDPGTVAGKLIEQPKRFWEKGFTLIELMIVITIIGILATIALPTYQTATIRAKEAVLKENLFTLRNVIDQYYTDQGVYPESLEELVEKHYLRTIPLDPLTKLKDTWITIPPPEEEGEGEATGIFDVHSGSDLIGLNGIPYNEW